MSRTRLAVAIAVCLISGAALGQAENANEEACVAKAREAALPPAGVVVTVISGEASGGRSFVRMSWAGDAFECSFRGGVLIDANRARLLIMGPEIDREQRERLRRERTK